MKVNPLKNDTLEDGSSLECGHKEGTICLKCATKTFNDFEKEIQRLGEQYEKLEQRFEIFQGRSDKPLCWGCRFGTCVQIRIPSSNSLVQSIDNEPWKDTKSAEMMDLWHIVCAFPGYAPGSMPNRFIATDVLNCNNFTERKNKTKKSSKRDVK